MGLLCGRVGSGKSSADRDEKPRVIGKRDVMMHLKGRGYMHIVGRKDSASPGSYGG